MAKKPVTKHQWLDRINRLNKKHDKLVESITPDNINDYDFNQEYSKALNKIDKGLVEAYQALEELDKPEVHEILANSHRPIL